MLMKFEAFLELLGKTSADVPAGVRKLLDELLSNGVGAQAKRNIYDERLMDDGEWGTLVEAIMKVPGTYKDVTGAIREVMRARKLRGISAKIPHGAIFGRAVTSKSLAQALYGQAALGTLASAIHHVGLYKHVRAEILRKRWRNILLGRHVMWATFDPTGGDPFSFAEVPHEAKDISPVLGLGEDTRFEPLLLIRYELPTTFSAQIPRISEAYAGDVWVYHFRPADSDDVDRGHGRTYVWDSHAKTHAGRPEIVHEPITGEHIAADIEEAPLCR